MSGVGWRLRGLGDIGNGGGVRKSAPDLFPVVSGINEAWSVFL